MYRSHADYQNDILLAEQCQTRLVNLLKEVPPAIQRQTYDIAEPLLKEGHVNDYDGYRQRVANAESAINQLMSFHRQDIWIKQQACIPPVPVKLIPVKPKETFVHNHKSEKLWQYKKTYIFPRVEKIDRLVKDNVHHQHQKDAANEAIALLYKYTDSHLDRKYYLSTDFDEVDNVKIPAVIEKYKNIPTNCVIC